MIYDFYSGPLPQCDQLPIAGRKPGAEVMSVISKDK